MEIPEPRIIRVTQREIDEGEPSNGESCAVALAIGHEFPGQDVYVDDTDIFVTSNGVMYHMDTPEEAARFIILFDTEQPVEPFEFKLELHVQPDC